MWSYIVGGVFLALAIYFLVQGIRCGAAVCCCRDKQQFLSVLAAA